MRRAIVITLLVLAGCGVEESTVMVTDASSSTAATVPRTTTTRVPAAPTSTIPAAVAAEVIAIDQYLDNGGVEAFKKYHADFGNLVAVLNASKGMADEDRYDLIGEPCDAVGDSAALVMASLPTPRPYWASEMELAMKAATEVAYQCEQASANHDEAALIRSAGAIGEMNDHIDRANAALDDAMELTQPYLDNAKK